jgi:hypothetical protein
MRSLALCDFVSHTSFVLLSDAPDEDDRVVQRDDLFGV